MENKNTKAKILGLVSFGHFTNDFSLTFAQIGLITLVYQLSASILQPLVRLFTDRYHKPYSIAFSMFCTFIGLTSLAFATNYYLILVSAILIGIGSSIFHPEASRIARMAAFGEKYGLAQSVFQIGGNLGSAIGPLIAVWLVLPNGQSSQLLHFYLFLF